MTANAQRVAAFWAAFVASLDADDPRRAASPDRFAFGGESMPHLADGLAALVLAGRKRGTASLPIEYTASEERLPQRGDLSIVLDGRGAPVVIIERTAVTQVAFGDVDADFAACEGEGDGSLGYWRAAHTAYFTAVCERHGGRLEPCTPVLCQRFEVVWPPRAPVVG